MTVTPAMWLYVMLGGAAGAAFRFGVHQLFHPAFTWPLGTFIVNGVGSCLLGVLAGYGMTADPLVRPLVMVGLLGALTTMSTFSFEVVALMQAGKVAMAGGYWLATVIGCPILAALGYVLAQSMKATS